MHEPPGSSPGEGARRAEPKEVRCRIQAHLERDEAAIAEDLEYSGRYILATNVLKLKGDELLTEYKGRQSVERGFRFLKEPLFFASSVFVKSPRRVAAIAMVMGLCLLIYALGERSLRRALEEWGRVFATRRASLPRSRCCGGCSSCSRPCIC